MTAIEWTDQTWNPTTGCSKVSPGCDHCYAETLSLRYGWSKKPWTIENEAENVVLHEDRLAKPLTWKKPSRVFVNSMSDLFHERIPHSFTDAVFEVMEATPQHTYQVLTKRPRMALNYLRGLSPLPNVWIGVSIESWRFNWRADVLREVPAAVRFISAEPLLDTLYGRRPLDLTGIDWLIVGGESGPGHRPMHLAWVYELRDAAVDNGTAFFFKQWGGRTPKAGGRELDARTWDEYPTPGACDMNGGTHTTPASSLFRHLPPIEGKAYCGCGCGARASHAPMDGLPHPGFGGVSFVKDGEGVAELHEGATFADYEAVAAADPDHDWRIYINGPLADYAYQRQGEALWALVEQGPGFA